MTSARRESEAHPRMLHQDRVRAGSFGADAAQYDRARPTYPDLMVDDLVGNGAGQVLDVGCGTGIAGRLFARRGCHVLGVEPDDRMAALARRSGLDVETAKFEDWDSKGRAFDLLVSGQAWHWVDPNAGARKAASVLLPGARMGLFWNWGRHEAGVGAAFDAVYRRLALDVDTHSVVLGHMSDDRFGLATAALEQTAAFEQIEQRTYRWQKSYSRDEWLDHLPTHSDHRTLPPERLAELLDAVGQAIDERGGAFTMRYDTMLVSAVRREDQEGPGPTD